MKKQLTSAIRQLSFSGLLLIAASAAKAQSATSDTTVQSGSNTIQYQGTQDDLMTFTISYDNPGGSPFYLSVKDQDGAELYRNVFRDKHFYKQFRLPKADKSKLTFLIHGKNTDLVKNFSINVNSRLVQDVAVKKVI